MILREKTYGKSFCSFDPMTMMAAGTAMNMGGTIFGGLMSSGAEKKRAGQIRAAGEKGSRDILSSMTDANAIAKENLGIARDDLSPFAGFGKTAGETLMGMLQGGDPMSIMQASPLFNFESDLGARNINRELAARGLYGSGAGLETLARFNTQLVGEEGQRMTDRLFGVMQLGQGAATSMAGMTNSTGQFMGNMRYQGGVDSANMRYNSTVGAAQVQSNATQMLGQMGKDLFGQAGQGLMQYGNFMANKPMIDSAVNANNALASKFGMTGGG